jgi:uncharacterized protein (TIGR02246 family)
MSNQRPTLDVDENVAREGHDAVDRFVQELQAGWDRHDAEISNRHFAQNVVWGSPFGETVHGYEPLHAVHTRLKAQGVGGPSSRFELVRVLVPTPDVAIAQVRRVALPPSDELETAGAVGAGTSRAFSEMALYVLVRRGGEWWLAAGQNTPIRDLPSDRASL